MGMVATGTTAGGELEKQMLAFFGMPSMDELCAHLKKTQGSLDAAQQKGLQFLQGNSLWCRGSVHDSYVSTFSKTFLNAVTGPLTTRHPINDFIAKATNGLIKDMLQEDPEKNDVALLVNTAYFKGTWSSQFKTEKTQPQPFHGCTREGNVPLMHQKISSGKTTHDVRHAVKVDVRGVNADVLVLPYEGGRVAGVFVLPSKAADYESLVTAMADGAGWTALHKASGKHDVHIYIPRFKMESKLYDLTRLLKKDSLPALTKEGQMGRVSEDPRLAVSRVLHKAVVEVNEEGTEAAAATVVTLKKRCMPRPPQTFRCDRSFLFCVYDTETKVPIFAGAIRDL